MQKKSNPQNVVIQQYATINLLAQNNWLIDTVMFY